MKNVNIIYSCVVYDKNPNGSTNLDSIDLKHVTFTVTRQGCIRISTPMDAGYAYVSYMPHPISGIDVVISKHANYPIDKALIVGALRAVNIEGELTHAGFNRYHIEIPIPVDNIVIAQYDEHSCRIMLGGTFLGHVETAKDLEELRTSIPHGNAIVDHVKSKLVKLSEFPEQYAKPLRDALHLANELKFVTYQNIVNIPKIDYVFDTNIKYNNLYNRGYLVHYDPKMLAGTYLVTNQDGKPLVMHTHMGWCMIRDKALVDFSKSHPFGATVGFTENMHDLIGALIAGGYERT